MQQDATIVDAVEKQVSDWNTLNESKYLILSTYIIWWKVWGFFERAKHHQLF